MNDGVVYSASYEREPSPSEAELAEAAHALDFQLLPTAAVPAGLRGLLEAWQEVAINGGSFSASIAIAGVQPATEWCLRNNRLERLDYTRRLVGSAAMTAALPDHGTDPTMLRQAKFTPLHPLQLDGDLALRLVHGGAHRTFPGTTEQVRAIAAEAGRALIAGRYDDTVIATSYDGWAPWFNWGPWDRTWIITDTENRAVTVVALTDTD